MRGVMCLDAPESMSQWLSFLQGVGHPAKATGSVGWDSPVEISCCGFRTLCRVTGAGKSPVVKLDCPTLSESQAMYSQLASSLLAVVAMLAAPACRFALLLW